MRPWYAYVIFIIRFIFIIADLRRFYDSFADIIEIELN